MERNFEDDIAVFSGWFENSLEPDEKLIWAGGQTAKGTTEKKESKKSLGRGITYAGMAVMFASFAGYKFLDLGTLYFVIGLLLGLAVVFAGAFRFSSADSNGYAITDKRFIFSYDGMEKSFPLEWVTKVSCCESRSAQERAEGRGTLKVTFSHMIQQPRKAPYKSTEFRSFKGIADAERVKQILEKAVRERTMYAAQTAEQGE